MELLHLRGPGDELRTFEETRIIERADLDEHTRGRTFRASGEMNSARGAEVPGGAPWVILAREGARSAAGKPERFGIDGHKKISCATRNHLAGPAEAKALHKLRFLALVADLAAITSASE